MASILEGLLERLGKGIPAAGPRFRNPLADPALTKARLGGYIGKERAQAFRNIARMGKGIGTGTQIVGGLFGMSALGSAFGEDGTWAGAGAKGAMAYGFLAGGGGIKKATSNLLQGMRKGVRTQGMERWGAKQIAGGYTGRDAAGKLIHQSLAGKMGPGIKKQFTTTGRRAIGAAGIGAGIGVAGIGAYSAFGG